VASFAIDHPSWGQINWWCCTAHAYNKQTDIVITVQPPSLTMSCIFGAAAIHSAAYIPSCVIEIMTTSYRPWSSNVVGDSNATIHQERHHPPLPPPWCHPPAIVWWSTCCLMMMT
jgi:hypothetical protein